MNIFHVTFSSILIIDIIIATKAIAITIITTIIVVLKMTLFEISLFKRENHLMNANNSCFDYSFVIYLIAN